MTTPSVLGADLVFRALADPHRRDLLDILQTRGPQTLSALCANRGLSRQAISKHLKVLELARLIRVVRRGRERIHSLTPDPLRAIEPWIVKLGTPGRLT